jgi:ligand-binding sensor domain-containing protein
MPVGFPSIRVDRANPLHHLWCNNGTWWVHYTIHFDHRKRRIRRSLETRSLTEAILRRDSLLLQITSDGEAVPERKRDGGAALDHRTVA